MRRGTFRTRQWQRLLRRVDLEYRGFHHVRHTFATLSLGADVPITAVGRDHGPAKPSMMLNIFGHVLKQHRTAATQTITKFLG